MALMDAWCFVFDISISMHVTVNNFQKQIVLYCWIIKRTGSCSIRISGVWRYMMRIFRHRSAYLSAESETCRTWLTTRFCKISNFSVKTVRCSNLGTSFTMLHISRSSLAAIFIVVCDSLCISSCSNCISCSYTAA